MIWIVLVSGITSPLWLPCVYALLTRRARTAARAADRAAITAASARARAVRAQLDRERDRQAQP